MDDESIRKLADVVADRVFEQMAKFVDVIEGLVRENEALQAKVGMLECVVFGHEHPDDDDDDLSSFEDFTPSDDDDRREFFDVDYAWETPDEDSEPTFD